MATSDEVDPLERGVRAGLERITRYRMALDDGATQAAVETTRGILGEPGMEGSDRAVELFGEVLAVATNARATFNEPELSRTEIHEYLRQSWTFLNSFRHA